MVVVDFAIFTANCENLEPALRSYFSEDKKDFEGWPLMVGCQSIAGFDAVEQGRKVDKSVVGQSLRALAM